MQVLLLHEELQAVVFPLQVLQQDARRLALRVLHIIHVELGKVARHDPSRPLGVGQHGGVSLRLLEGREQRAVALPDALSEILAQ